MLHDAGDIYELKKDICMPGHHLRAGARKTKGEWLVLYPEGVTNYAEEWFYNVTRQGIPKELSREAYIVDIVFRNMGLTSIAYREAAIECLKEFIRRTPLLNGG